MESSSSDSQGQSFIHY